MAPGPRAVGDASEDYARALEVLDRALTFGINPSLEGIRLLTDALGRPQDTFASVQVGGTNGKTSVTRMTAALLQGEGFSTAAYTSPHLTSYTERIEVGGKPVSQDDFARAVLLSSAAAEALECERADASAGTGVSVHEAAGKGVHQAAGAGGFTEFELLTAAALWLFRDVGADYAVLEVGLGGRWDATSVVSPSVSVITGVGLDHTDRLGGTLEEIAADKAHIIKPASVTVLGPETASVAAIFLDKARTLGTPVWFVAQEGQPSVVAADSTPRFRVSERPTGPGGTLTLDVRGIYGDYCGVRLHAPSYQAPNVAVAVVAAEAAVARALDLEATRRSIAAITFPGRFEVVRRDPPLVLDGAHNPQAAVALASAIDEAFGRRLPVAVLGILSDKDAEGIVEALAGHVSGFIATQPESPRALAASDLAATVERLTGMPCPAIPDLNAAVVAARDARAGAVVTGSLYTAGQARELWSC